MRRSICEAMFSATSCALSSGCLISWMEMRTLLPKRFSRSSRSWSTDDPPLPMTMPGLAVWMVTVSWALDERSVSIFAMPALRRRARIVRLISRSSCSIFV